MRFPKRKDVKLHFFLSSLILILILIKGILELNRSAVKRRIFAICFISGHDLKYNRPKWNHHKNSSKATPPVLSHRPLAELLFSSEQVLSIFQLNLLIFFQNLAVCCVSIWSNQYSFGWNW